MQQKFLVAVLVLGCLVGAGSLAWSEAPPYTKWNYRITVAIETPEGLKTGSAVREVTNRFNGGGWILPDVAARISSIKGEAVVIDLGERGVLFALIEHGSYGELYSAFSVKDASQTTDDFKNLRLGLSAPLPEPNWPMFVKFADIQDPKSVVLVRGWRFDSKTQKQILVNDFEKYFGAGVRVEDITISIVDEPVTWDILNRYLTDDFWDRFASWWSQIDAKEKMKYVRFFNFNTGSQKNE